MSYAKFLGPFSQNKAQKICSVSGDTSRLHEDIGSSRANVCCKCPHLGKRNWGNISKIEIFGKISTSSNI